MENNPNNQVIITGGTGFLGLNLAKFLKEKGYEPVVISRNKPRNPLPYQHLQWDSRTVGDWKDALDGSLAIVNLAGRTVDCIKTPDRCDEILRSRVESTLAIGKAVRAIENPPKIWVQMSTAHIYGDPPTLRCDEDAAFGYGLAPFVGKAWEAAYAEAILPNMRQVILRTSFVLGRTGGALKSLAKIARLGLGGKVGSGQQGISWIHEDDMNALFFRAITDENMKGAYMTTAPNPVSNKAFMKALRKALKVPIGLPATEWMTRIGARLFFNTDPELALYGRYCISKRLKEEGFEFKFPEIEGALKSIYSKV